MYFLCYVHLCTVAISVADGLWRYCVWLGPEWRDCDRWIGGVRCHNLRLADAAGVYPKKSATRTRSRPRRAKPS